MNTKPSTEPGKTILAPVQVMGPDVAGSPGRDEPIAKNAKKNTVILSLPVRIVCVQDLGQESGAVISAQREKPVVRTVRMSGTY